MITRFRVQNYKALRDVTLDLTPIHVLIGPNDSGKTSILEAVRALCESIRHPLSQCFPEPWDGHSLVSSSAAGSDIHFSAAGEIARGSWEYGFAVQFSNVGRELKVIDEAIGANAVSSIGERTRLFQLNKTPLPMDELAQCIIESIDDVQFYRWVPRNLSLPNAPDSRRRFKMDSTGFGLTLLIDNILGDSRQKFDALESRLQTVFPQVESLQLKPETAFKAPPETGDRVLRLDSSDGKGLYFKFVGNENSVSARNVSDGLLLVLAYMALLYSPEPPKVLLIEEPENGVHPGLLAEVMKILRELISEQSHTQVILTTHSPYLVSEFDPSEVTLCVKGPDGAVTTRNLSDSKPVREQIDIFNLGEIWTAEGDAALMQAAETAEARP